MTMVPVVGLRLTEGRSGSTLLMQLLGMDPREQFRTTRRRFASMRRASIHDEGGDCRQHKQHHRENDDTSVDEG